MMLLNPLWLNWVRLAALKRISLAKKLLKKITCSVLQVGDRLGYPDSNNFLTGFKLEYKLLPRHYRKSLS
jgi:AraC-like DNA-binding protein